MGWNNPPIPWSEFERKLSDARRPSSIPLAADGGDSPAWSHKREPYIPPALPETEGLEEQAGQQEQGDETEQGGTQEQGGAAPSDGGGEG